MQKRTGVCGPCDIICTNGESNLCRQCASPMLYQLSSILNEYRLDWTSFWTHDWFLCHSKKKLFMYFFLQWETQSNDQPLITTILSQPIIFPSMCYHYMPAGQATSLLCDHLSPSPTVGHISGFRLFCENFNTAHYTPVTPQQSMLPEH